MKKRGLKREDNTEEGDGGMENFGKYLAEVDLARVTLEREKFVFAKEKLEKEMEERKKKRE